MRKWLLIGMSALGLAGCSSTAREAEVQSAFQRFQAALAEGDNVAVYELFDSESRLYFTRIGQLALSGTETEKSAFCQYTDQPWSTRYLLRAGEYMAQIEGAAAFPPLKVIVTAQALSFGILDETQLPDYRFDQVESISGDEAVAIVNHRLNGDAWVRSKFTFHHEDGEWRLNYGSTLTLMERYLATQARRSGLDPRAYIDKLLLEGDTTGAKVYDDPSPATSRRGE